MNTDRITWQDGTIAVAMADVDTRSKFITRTYVHVLGAILAFTLIEVFLFRSGLMESISETIFAWGNFGWLAVLGGFMVVGWLATRTAHSARSPVAQYAALGAYVAADALIFCPLLYIAATVVPGAISNAAVITIVGFLALTAVAFYTRKDFSFLRGVLMWGGIAAVGLIVLSVVIGFNLGLLFSVAMVVFAGAAVLYDTSNVLHHYPADRHVAAALQLFASIALMFWYVLRIVMSLSRD